MNVNPDDVRAGQAFYSSWTLPWYDLYVLGFSCRFVWKCPSRVLLEHYNRHVGASHLELGVGTGYFIDRCRFPVPQPRITLVDLNPACLAATARRISRFHPEAFVRNALEPLDLPDRTYDSAALNFVLHCLPGTMRSKGVVFDHLRRVVRPGGVIFGSTLLGQGVELGALARRLTRLYNRRRIFTNLEDSLDALHEVLRTRFATFEVGTVGNTALFAARV